MWTVSNIMWISIMAVLYKQQHRQKTNGRLFLEIFCSWGSISVHFGTLFHEIILNDGRTNNAVYGGATQPQFRQYHILPLSPCLMLCDYNQGHTLLKKHDKLFKKKITHNLWWTLPLQVISYPILLPIAPEMNPSIYLFHSPPLPNHAEFSILRIILSQQ